MDRIENTADRTIHSYVIRSGRMSPLQQRAYDSLIPIWGISFQEELLDLESIFPPGEIIVEIGFGMGTATAAIADENRDRNYLGIEVHKPGVGKLLSEIQRLELSNIRIVHFDAVRVLESMIPGNSISGFHIFFPDPWPKKRHHKRRLIQPAFADLLCSRLKAGGYIYCATDWEEYGQQMLEVFSAREELENSREQWAETPVWRPKTAFERKGLTKNHKIREVFFRKIKDTGV